MTSLTTQSRGPLRRMKRGLATMQFAAMLNRGSPPPAVFAFNSANVEGWALYRRPYEQYLPLDGQLALLQMRMMRAARAFLDPMLNLGMIEPPAPSGFYGRGPAFRTDGEAEVDRYTFNSPDRQRRTSTATPSSKHSEPGRSWPWATNSTCRPTTTSSSTRVSFHRTCSKRR